MLVLHWYLYMLYSSTMSLLTSSCHYCIEKLPLRNRQGPSVTFTSNRYVMRYTLPLSLSDLLSLLHTMPLELIAFLCPVHCT